MKWTIGILTLALLSALDVSASDGEKATYVGGGRYVGEGKSVDDAVLHQRNNEWTQRQQDRQENEQRHDRSERRERDRDYQRNSDDY